MKVISVEEILSVIFGPFKSLLCREIREREQKHRRSTRGLPDYVHRGVKPLPIFTHYKRTLQEENLKLDNNSKLLWTEPT